MISSFRDPRVCTFAVLCLACISVNAQTPGGTGGTGGFTREHEDIFIDVPSGQTSFVTGQLLGRLGRENDVPPLTYTSNAPPSLLRVLIDGRIIVQDGPALTAYIAINERLTVSFTGTDGVNSFASQFVLGKGSGGLNQNLIRIESSGGFTYTSTAGTTGLIWILNDIKNSGHTITTGFIKGHGGPEGIQLDGPMEGGNWLTGAGDGIQAGSNDITQLLKDVTNGNTQFQLKGCFTAELAQDIEATLGNGADVTGAVRFVIGIPGTGIGIGVYR